MNSDTDAISSHSSAAESYDSDVDETQCEDQTEPEKLNWLSENMSGNPYHYQLSDYTLWKNLAKIPQPDE
ncbi:hypothetical protein IWQ62_001267, partial [Dispira parvispora]